MYAYQFLCGHTFLIWRNTWAGNHWVLLQDYISKKLPNCLPKYPYYFAFSPALNESFFHLYSQQHLTLSIFWILVILVGVRNVLFNLHFPDESNVGYFFIYIFAIYVSSISSQGAQKFNNNCSL